MFEGLLEKGWVIRGYQCGLPGIGDDVLDVDVPIEPLEFITIQCVLDEVRGRQLHLPFNER